MAKHNWTWKTTDRGYWVVCRDCGLSDRYYEKQQDAEARILALKNLSPHGPQTTHRLFAKPGKRVRRKSTLRVVGSTLAGAPLNNTVALEEVIPEPSLEQRAQAAGLVLPK